MEFNSGFKGLSNSDYVYRQLVQNKRFENNVGIQACEEERRFQVDC